MNLRSAIKELVSFHGNVATAAKATGLHRATIWKYLNTARPINLRNTTLNKLGLRKKIHVSYMWKYD